jgi:hypothetical protein
VASYLHTLAARALGDLPVVRPRQPSRFEPAMSADVAPFEALENDEFVAINTPVSDEPVTRRATAPQPKPLAAHPAAMARDGRREPLEETRAMRPPAAPSSRVTEPPLALTNFADVADPMPQAPRSQTPPALDQARILRPEAVRRAESSLPITTAAPTPMRQFEVPVLRASAPPTVAPAQAPRAAARLGTDAAETDMVPPRTLPRQREGFAEADVRRVAVARQDLDASLAPERDGGTPAITVSIGRIEVRASRPEPARTVARTPRPQPRLTLDAFLSRQGRGR